MSSLSVRPVSRPGLGAAVDIGTTTIVARVYDLESGRLVRQTSAFNPQRNVAADVMGRISAAIDGRLQEMSASVRSQIRTLFWGLDVSESVVVGNTTMLHLFVGDSPSDYAVAPFVARRLFGERLSINGVETLLPRCAHAFFGADAVAAVLASNLCESSDSALLADIGTNGELAFWHDGRLTVTSVAAGPAFERPGICGSDLVSALAEGLENGAVDETGLAVGRLEHGVTQEDVRAVQLAKAAVFAGIQTVLGNVRGRVRRFVLAGGLGSGVDLRHAARIGLFPSELLPVARACGNLAIEGASALLLDPTLADAADRLARNACHLELGGNADFSSRFMSAIGFSPLGA